MGEKFRQSAELFRLHECRKLPTIIKRNFIDLIFKGFVTLTIVSRHAILYPNYAVKYCKEVFLLWDPHLFIR